MRRGSVKWRVDDRRGSRAWRSSARRCRRSGSSGGWGGGSSGSGGGGGRSGCCRGSGIDWQFHFESADLESLLDDIERHGEKFRQHARTEA